jgi:glycerol-3-phosphate dehydrogenase
VTGGKLTTFRLIAQDALKAAARRLPALTAVPTKTAARRLPALTAVATKTAARQWPALMPVATKTAARRLPALTAVATKTAASDPRRSLTDDSGPALRVSGRYGAETADVLAAAEPGELEPLAGTPVTAAELRWAARCEGVAHLDDLLLRRVRVGLLLPEGGAELFPLVRRICQQELAWTDTRWEQEQASYSGLIARSHSAPG